jgi:hypothetical protein
LAFAALLLWFYSRYLFDADYYSILDWANLTIHEGGHMVCAFLPRFLMVAGGTGMQLAMPAAFALHFRRENSPFSSDVCLFWLGQNLLNVSHYMGDARTQRLPLVAGGVHDWTYMLETLGLLTHDVGLSRLVFAGGSLVIAASIWRIAAPALGVPAPSRAV